MGLIGEQTIDGAISRRGAALESADAPGGGNVGLADASRSPLWLVHRPVVQPAHDRGKSVLRGASATARVTFHVPNDRRQRTGVRGSVDDDGNNGAFLLPGLVRSDRLIFCIASDGLGWEHVSVSIRENGRPRTPVWPEMVAVKDTFWDEEDVVIQFHPRRSEYVNCHENVLHLWRPVGVELPTPDPILVGPR